MSRIPTRTVVFSLLAVLGLAAPAAGLTAPEPVPQRLALDVTGLLPDPETQAHDGGFPPEISEGIGPGTRLFIHIGAARYLCTANFLWTAAGKYYIGAAGHCFLPAGKKATHGPGADYDTTGIKVYACTRTCVLGGYATTAFAGGYTLLGPVAYARQTGTGGDIGNDFGLVEIPTALEPLLRPGLPVFGGPHAYAAGRAGDTVCQYGHGVVYGETFVTQGRTGVHAGVSGNRFTYYGLSGGGDSGSAVVNCKVDANGFHATSALGILTHAVQVPQVGMGLGITYGTTVPRAITMAQDAGLNISLVTG